MRRRRPLVVRRGRLSVASENFSPAAGRGFPSPARRAARGLVLALIAAVALAGGCAHAEAPAVSDCSSTAPGAVLVTAEVHDGQAMPAPHRVLVPSGSTVQVKVAADKVVQVHIHGYDLQYDAVPGTPGCVSFVADRPGLFDVEAHPSTLLLQLEVR